MKSSYKKLGNYIELVSCLNNELQYGETDVRGVSNNKEIIQTRANNEGRDFNTFYVVKPDEFIYNSRTSRMGDKVGLGFNDTKKTFITSFNNTVFRVTEEALLPKYLYMWFNRPEFDRYVRFHSWGSSTEIFSWDEMCNTLLPVPSIDKQREIVKEYNVIQNRIDLNKQLIQKLEETAQAIYKQWFVDFEFPNEDGLPYKSNGGEMVESEKGEIPKGWEVGNLQKIILFKNGKSKPTKKGANPVYGGNGIIEYVDNHNDENVIAIGRVGAYCGSLYRVLGKCWISDNAISAKSKINANMFSYYVLNDLNLNERSEGTGQPLITQGLLNGIRITIPEKHAINRFEIVANTIFKKQDVISHENQKLSELKDLLLSKLATIKN